ncbi:MAG TPA: efflux RND transporter periplasmic adaptor subunit [Ramlibacter sp.]|uniref:efflux RND transporter periplasmic adaptor subunit n=1 Tax=Ramlibacter sp. TaxID=1917967 RepID=UPI002B669FB0|nr:efflux RND transporter periplasmic adaptor subunit [Ramlibacter sp.]HVZ44719.1 efflux RND transporter periplasmic adaptor subunit [Ramlibacter sp.]
MQENEPRRLGRRAAIVGTVLALLAVAGLGWLAWSLTHPDSETTAAQGRGGFGGPGGGRGGGPGGRGGRAAVTVGVATAESADIPVIIEALGTVVPEATVRVRAQVNGVLTRVLFKEGQPLKKGELMAEIDPRPFEAALQQALGQRQKDEAQLQAARVTLQRYQTLLKEDSIARQDVDTQAALVKQLEAQTTSDRGNEQQARLNVSYTRIVAPIGGRVGLRNVDVGNVVSTGDTNGVAVITQIMPIDVEFAVPQDHAAWLQHNAGAFMEVKAYDRTRTTMLDTGVFASLDNQIDQQTGTVRAKARFNNARLQLFPSQFVNVQLQIRTIQDAVVVPVSALRQGANGEYVFVLLDNRTVQLRPVVRGQPLGDRIQIATGLKVGEKVITEGADRLRDGSPVILPGDQPAAGGGGFGGRRRHGASDAAQPAASQAFTGASAAKAPQIGPGPTPPWAPASAMMGSQGQNTPVARSGAAQDLTPEEREARRKRFESMSPEERQKLRERLQSMSPEERAALRQKYRQQRPSGEGQ